LVIYAAQLSQAFFSCLATSVEGFLDLFLVASPAPAANMEVSSFDEGSIHSNMQTTRTLPAGALASIVLWCDAELTKFGAAFGGTRILGNLALSPPPREPTKKGPRVLGQSSEESNGNKDRQVRPSLIDVLPYFLVSIANLFLISSSRVLYYMSEDCD
jgi:hypothetical protein